MTVLLRNPGSSSSSGMAIGSAVTSGTAGSVLFIDSSANLGQDNPNFYWDPFGTIGRQLLLRGSGLTQKTLTLRGFASSSSAGAQPDTITGLQAWYKADSLSLNDGDLVASWTDSSSNARDATQSTGSLKPIYRKSALNGKPGILFDGTDDYLSISGLSFSSAASIFIVAQNTDLTSQGSFFLVDSGNSGHYIGVDTNGGYAALKKGRFLLAHDDSGFGAGGVAAGSVVQSSGFYLMSVVQNGANATAYTSGVAGTANASMSSGTFTINRISGYVTSSLTVHGYICEIIVYNAALSSADQQAVENYLATKYGIPGPSSSSQSANILELVDAGLNPLGWADSSGNFYTNGSFTSYAGADFDANNSTFHIDTTNHRVSIGQLVPTAPLHVQVTGASSGTDYEVARFDTSSSGSPYLTVGVNSGGNGGGYILFEKNNAVIRFGTHSQNGYFARFSTSGSLFGTTSGSGLSEGFDGVLKLLPHTTTQKGLVAKAALSGTQTANLIECQDKNANVIAQVNATGNISEAMGTTTTLMTEIGVANVQTSSAGVGNGADTTDDTLFTYSLPSNAMSANGKSSRIVSSGHFATNANLKRVKIFFAGTAVADSGTLTLSNTDWKCEAEVTRIDSTHLSCVGTFIGSGSSPVVTVTPNLAVSDLTANASVIKTTGASTVTGAANDVLGYLQKTWFEN